MQIEIGKWGNSAATRIPAELMRKAGLSVGSKVEITVKNGTLQLKPVNVKISRAERLEKLLASYKKHGPDEEIDWGADVGNETIE